MKLAAKGNVRTTPLPENEEPAPPSLRNIIQKGILPENLPPAIHSEALWIHFESTDDYLTTKKTIGSLSSYNASKRGGHRRLFGIPHPNFIFDQSKYFNAHWPSLRLVMAEATGSLSTPITSAEGRRSVRITPHSELPKQRLKALSRYKYCITTDVSRCFPSIYTHSIPWAINGKIQAKRDSNYESIEVHGNRLDFIFRQAQQRQTIGIPVGPDTSRITSELILSAVDKDFLLHQASPRFTYLRHVDDYWVGANNLEDCEKLLAQLRKSLRSYELDTNEFKTKISTTNNIFGESWPSEFERELKQSLGTHDRNSIVATLGKVIERATSENDDGMIRHAIRKLDEGRYWSKEWDILEHFLAQCAVQFPHSFDYVARVISWRKRTEAGLDEELWKDVTQDVAHTSSSLGRDAEALWSLWLMKELKLRISKKLSDSIIDNNGAIVRGYLAHAYANGATSDRRISAGLWSSVDGNVYSGPDWPLTLELMHLDIKPAMPVKAKGEDQLRHLHDKQATLVEWSASPLVFASGNDDDPEKAIEDFASEYDSDDDFEVENDAILEW